MWKQCREHHLSRVRAKNRPWRRELPDEEMIKSYPAEAVRNVNSIFYYIEQYSPKVFIYYVLRNMTICDISEQLNLDGTTIRKILEYRDVRLRYREGRGW